MSVTFSQINTGLDAISGLIVSDRADAVQAKANLQAVVDRLTALGTQYSQFVSDVDAALAASPSDPALINAKAAKDRLVAEFTALKTAVQNGVAALNV